jgi:hypothetical protein
MKQNQSIIIEESIENKIFLIRNQKVMTDSDLANLYEVDTKVLNQNEANALYACRNQRQNLGNGVKIR